MLFAELPEVIGQSILLHLSQKFVVFQRTVRQHDPNDFLKRTGAGAANGGEKAGDDILFVEIFDLQVVEPLGPLFIGEKLDVFLDDGLVLLIDPQVH